MSEATEKLIVSIVLAGQFNPAILSPAWFQKTELVTDEEVAAATVSVIHPEVAIFKVGDFTIDARTNRFSILVESEPVIRVLDAAEILFATLLPHSPVQQFGINYQEHFRLDNSQRRLAFGRALAPLAPWGRWGERISSLKGEETSGVAALVMREIYPDEGGYRQVDVQPSGDEDLKSSGVFVSVNDHRVIAKGESSVPAGEAIKAVIERFDSSIAKGRETVEDLYVFARDLRIA